MTIGQVPVTRVPMNTPVYFPVCANQAASEFFVISQIMEKKSKWFIGIRKK